VFGNVYDECLHKLGFHARVTVNKMQTNEISSDEENINTREQTNTLL